MGQRVEFELVSSDPGNRDSLFSLQQVLRGLYRHKGKEFLVVFLVMAAALAYLALARKSYRAEGKLFLRLGRENVALDPTATLGQGSAVVVPATRESEVNSVAEILRSRGLMEKVVDTLGPANLLDGKGDSHDGKNDSSKGDAEQIAASVGDKADRSRSTGDVIQDFLGRLTSYVSFGDRERAIQGLMRNVRVEAVPKSNIISISYCGSSPDRSRQVVGQVMDFYLEQHLRLNRPNGAQDFLVEQTERLRSNLAKSESELRDLMNAQCLIFPEGRREAMVKDESRLESALREATASVAASSAAISELSAALDKLPQVQLSEEKSGINDYGTDLMRGQLYGLQMKEQEVLAKYTESHPATQRIRAEVSGAKDAVGQESRTRREVVLGRGRPHEEARVLLVRENSARASERAKAEAIRAQLEAIRKEMRPFNDNEFRMRQLRREIDLQDANYRKYSENLEQTRIDGLLQSQRMSNISIVQPPTSELKPASPRLLSTLVMAGGLGVLAAAGVGFLAESMNPSQPGSRKRTGRGMSPVRTKASGIPRGPLATGDGNGDSPDRADKVATRHPR